MSELTQAPPDPLALLRSKMQGETDVMSVIRLEPDGDRFRYLIQTPFKTFPKFAIGTTDADLKNVKLLFGCGLRRNAMKEWRRRATTSGTRTVSKRTKIGQAPAVSRIPGSHF